MAALAVFLLHTFSTASPKIHIHSGFLSVNYHGSRSELDPWRLLLMLNNPTAFAAAYALVPSSVSSVLL